MDGGVTSPYIIRIFNPSPSPGDGTQVHKPDDDIVTAYEVTWIEALELLPGYGNSSDHTYNSNSAYVQSFTMGDYNNYDIYIFKLQSLG